MPLQTLGPITLKFRQSSHFQTESTKHGILGSRIPRKVLPKNHALCCEFQNYQKKKVLNCYYVICNEVIIVSYIELCLQEFHVLFTYISEHLLWTLFSKSQFWERNNFQKWSSLQKMIVLTRLSFGQEMSNIYFPLQNDPIGWFCQAQFHLAS